MAGFKATKKTPQLKAKYTGRVIVYLESQADYQIIAGRWFFDLGETLEFRPSDDTGGGGCNTVIQRVNVDRDNNIPAFGLVDRDALLRCFNWELWWETDDQRLAKARPFGDYVRVLKRWELENYLLSLKEIEMLLADAGRMRDVRDTETVAYEILGHEEELKILSAAVILHHEHGQQLNQNFGMGQHARSIREGLRNRLKQMQAEETKLDDYAEKIGEFGEGYERSARRWERLSRILDGKRTLNYLGQKFQYPFVERRGDLARHIRNQKKIDPELIAYIEEFKAAFT